MSRRGVLPGCVAVGVLLLAAAAGWWGWRQYRDFADTPLSAQPAAAGNADAAGSQTSALLLVERGDSFTRVLGKLRAAQVTGGHDWLWQVLAREMGVAARIQVGEYALEPGLTPRQLLLRLREGRVVRYQVTLVDGWTLREVRAALAKASPLVQTLGELDDAALMARIGRAGIPAEGRFLPETYTYARGNTDVEVLGWAADALDAALRDAWGSRAPELPLASPDEALVLASIIEKETGIADERARIAGVFVRRLRLGMRLQTDPTVIYGMGSRYSGNLRRVDLLADTPYNTYTRDGLPPTPIALAGTAALHAATHPEAGDALYFVAVGDGSGRHVFSRTLDEHNRAVAAYVRRYREQSGRN